MPGLDLNAAFDDSIFDNVRHWVSGAAKTVAHAVTGAVQAVGNWAGQALKDVGDLIKSMPTSCFFAAPFHSDTLTFACKDKTHFEIKPTVESANLPLHTDVSLSAGTAPVSCPDGKQAKVDVKFTNTGSIVVKAGIVIIGSVLPPVITEFAAFGGERWLPTASSASSLSCCDCRYQRRL